MNALKLSVLALACLPLAAGAVFGDDELNVTATIVFNGDPPGGVEIDLNAMLSPDPDYVPSTAAVWAGTSAHPRPSAGDRPDTALLRTYELSITGGGWNPDPVEVTWDADAAPDSFWCYVVYVVRHGTDATQPNKIYYAITQLPVPERNVPVVDYDGWEFFDITPSAPSSSL